MLPNREQPYYLFTGMDEYGQKGDHHFEPNHIIDIEQGTGSQTKDTQELAIHFFTKMKIDYVQF